LGAAARRHGKGTAFSTDDHGDHGERHPCGAPPPRHGNGTALSTPFDWAQGKQSSPFDSAGAMSGKRGSGTVHRPVIGEVGAAFLPVLSLSKGSPQFAAPTSVP
jgi:hypothetical protein